MSNLYDVNWNNIKKGVIETVGQEYAKEDKDTTPFLIAQEFERIMRHMKETENGLGWVIGKVSEPLLIKMISQWMVTNYSERKLLSQLSYEGIRYDYTPLIVPLGSLETYSDNEDIQQRINSFCQKEESLKENFSLESKLSQILEMITNHKGVDQLIEDFIDINEREIPSCYWKEKELAQAYGFLSVNPKQIAQYLKIAEAMVDGGLYNLIISHRGECQTDCLQIILEYIQYLRTEYVPQLYKECEYIEYQELSLDKKGTKTSAVSQMFVIYMQYRAWTMELKNIEESLMQEILDDKDNFSSPKPFKHNFTNQYTSKRELMKDLKEASSYGSNDSRILQEVKNFIEFWNENEGGLGDVENVGLNRVVYREIFKKPKNGTKHGMKRHASTIAYAIMDKCQVEKKEELFIEKKLQRGIMREQGLVSEYIMFNLIMETFRELLLSVLDFPEEELIFQIVNKVLHYTLAGLKEYYYFLKSVLEEQEEKLERSC